MGNIDSQPNPNIDIFTDQERKIMNDDKKKRVLYSSHFSDFVNQYIEDFDKRKKLNQKYFDSLDLSKRSRIRILVILTSEYEVLNVLKSKPEEDQYKKETELLNSTGDKSNENKKTHEEQKIDIPRSIHTAKSSERFFRNAGDAASALLIGQLFHNAFGIPFSQILITSTYDITFIQDDEFNFYQYVNLAQIRTKQYKFELEDSLISRVKEFNPKIINDEFQNCNDSDIFVFFLDHDSNDKFYECYLQSLLKIKCKHFYIFNDNCYSTSMIDLVRANIKFDKIFKNLKIKQFESQLFYFLSKVGFVEQNTVKEIIESKLSQENEKNINQYKCEISNALKLTFDDNQAQNDLIELINMLAQKYENGIMCNPRIFIEIGNKSTIFTSSISSGLSLTLPIRRIYVYYHTQFRSCGNIFSSIFIESFLSMPNSLESFCQSINQLLKKYKDEFYDVIIEQNKSNENDQNQNIKIASIDEINAIFNMNPTDENHFFDSPNMWPDFQSLKTDPRYWNIDESIVNKNEYNSISFGDLTIIQNALPNFITESEYGPKPDLDRLTKFLMDFQTEVNLKLKENGYNDIEFNVFEDENKEDKKIIYKNGYGDWGKFYSQIYPYVLYTLASGVMKLERPITKFFEDNEHKNSLQLTNLFSEAYKTIFKIWKYYSLD